ncbi:hypothetical protein PN492_19350 [Dolichospermum circinale CS-537/01]|uniref:Uncharacterized protein n=1 Tax=Dolichospermum circinale CS-537/01 TaxID=3021739 RepID=A0ABT5AAN2_9CYAN|nr:hypothetical protein [Dolichospermum circinale]MDB9488678.1 hypothetical protein [Dolichospermum circinale CS-537/01]
MTPYSPKTAIEFLRYCSLYNPIIDVNEQAIKNVTDIQLDRRSWFKGIEGQILINELDISLKKIKTFFKCQVSVQPSKKYKSATLKNLNTSELENQYFETLIYIYYELVDTSFQWVSVKLMQNSKLKLKTLGCYRKFWGVGKSISDADSHLMNHYHNYLQERDEKILWCLTKGIPLNCHDFINILKKNNLDVDENKVKIKYGSDEAGITSASYSILYIEGKANKYQVNINLEDLNVKWSIKRYYPVAIFVSGANFEEAIRLYYEKYNSLRADPEEWAKAVKITELKIEREMLEAERKEGQATYNWLVSEFGYDIFPDRD